MRHDPTGRKRSFRPSPLTIRRRIASGYTLSEAEQYGNEVVYSQRLYVDRTFYPNVQLLADDYELPYKTVWSRINKGFSAFEAIQYPSDVVYRKAYYYKTQFFPNLSLLARTVGVEPHLLKQRLKYDMTLEHAVLRPVTPRDAIPTTINGVPYASQSQAAKAHGISHRLFQSRIDRNWTPEQAAGVAPKPRDTRYKVGTEYFDSVQALADHFGKSVHSVRYQLGKGLSPEDAVRSASLFKARPD